MRRSWLQHQIMMNIICSLKMYMYAKFYVRDRGLYFIDRALLTVEEFFRKENILTQLKVSKYLIFVKLKFKINSFIQNWIMKISF